MCLFRVGVGVGVWNNEVQFFFFFANFEVLRVGLKVQVFWVMILCHLVVLGLHGP